MNAPLRIGAIPSLNALPLTAPLREVDPAVATITWNAPARLADALHAGHLDLALIPQVEMARDRSYRCVAGPAIACAGAVESILLFHETPWEEIGSVLVDGASRSSVELLRVLLNGRGRPLPVIAPAPDAFSPADLADSEADALLCIGDRALAARSTAVPSSDLGALWHAETGLPFVFALWVGREDAPLAAIELVLAAASAGHERRREIAEAFAAEHPAVISAPDAVRYLTRTLHHTWGERERIALERFAAERRALGSAVPEGWTPRTFSTGDGGAP